MQRLRWQAYSHLYSFFEGIAIAGVHSLVVTSKQGSRGPPKQRRYRSPKGCQGVRGSGGQGVGPQTRKVNQALGRVFCRSLPESRHKLPCSYALASRARIKDIAYLQYYMCKSFSVISCSYVLSLQPCCPKITNSRWKVNCLPNDLVLTCLVILK
jgi:hypothetical protein